MVKNIFLNNLIRLKEEKKESEKFVNQTLEKIKELVKNAQNIYIFTHENPDGDAIGSCVAMQIVLKSLGKNVVTYVKEVPKTYQFLEETKTFETDISKLSPNVDLAISLDCADLVRLDGGEFFKKAKTNFLIDHHISNQMYADVCFVDPNAPANTQILASILEYFELDFSKDVSDALMTGIITDTGGFQYKSVQPETFEFASHLLRNGVDVSDIYKKSLMTTTRTQFELIKIAQDRLEFFEDGKIAVTYITSEDMEKINAENSDTEGIVNIGKNIEGVELSIFLKQKDENTYKISFRSNSYVDVSSLASKFSGGGHIRAAGAKFEGNVEEAKTKILQEAKKVI